MTQTLKPIFISYSSKHRELTRQLAAVLEAQYGTGSVWWDHELEARAAYNTQIRAALDGARVVVVVWTAGAMVSDYVYAEAVRALGDGKLVNVRPADMSFRDIPEPFNIHHIDDAADHARILGTVAKVMSGTPIPTQVPLHEIYFGHHGQRLLNSKRADLPPDQTKISPTMLLQAKYEVVAFSDATGSCADMFAWCADRQRAAAGRLIHGPGGLGKTRLLIETAARLHSQGWMAGFLDRPPLTDAAATRQRWQALEQLIHHGDDNGLLIVINYAEGRQDEVAQLSAAIFGAGTQPARPIRLVLLARSADNWWPALTEEKEDVLRLFHRGGGATDVLALPGLDTSEGRIAFYRHCEAGLAGVLPAQSPLPRERLDRIAEGKHYDRPLAIQMEALLHLSKATPDLPGIDKQLDSVLGLERAHWDKLLGALDDDARRDMARGAAQVTAVNGAASEPSARRLLMADGHYAGTRTAPVHVDPVYRRLSAAYGAKDGALLALEPDLIGEHHVAATADTGLTGGCLAWIEAEPEDTREQRRRAIITVLQRATRAEHGAKAEKAVALLDHLVATALAPLATDMVAVMVDTPGRLETVLRARVAGLEDYDALATLHYALPHQSLALMDLSLAVAERLAALMKQLLNDVRTGSDEVTRLVVLGRLGRFTNDLGLRLAALGQHEEALTASGEAVAIFRGLAEADPATFLPDLATSLINLSTMLNNLGLREEALTAAAEAVDIYRRIGAPPTSSFAASLSNLGLRLSALRQWEKALATANEATDIYRYLAMGNPEVFNPQLAKSLSNLGNHLSDRGQRGKALAVTIEAVDIYRRLAEARPDAFLPELATSLSNLGNRLSNLGQREEALAAATQAVDIGRQLAKTRPDAFLPDLAMNLNNLGNRLSELGRQEEALATTAEAVDIRRQLAKTRPDAYLPYLATSLTNLGVKLSDLGLREKALAACQEAADISRRLAEARPDTFRANLAGSLSNLGMMFTAADRREEALAACQEAVDIFRHLADARPDTYFPGLAGSLSNLSRCLLSLSWGEEALVACQEASDIYRRLAEKHADAFLPELARSLNNLGATLSGLGRQEEGLVPCKEAVDVCRRLTETHPDAFFPDLARYLGGLAFTLLLAGQHDAAIAASAEGLSVIAPFVDRQPLAFGDLAKSLARGYLQACEKAGRDADTALLECVGRALGGSGTAADALPAIPDEAVQELMAHPDLQETLTAFMQENNLEGTPADLPIETQRALAAMIMQAMAQANREW